MIFERICTGVSIVLWAWIASKLSQKVLLPEGTVLGERAERGGEVPALESESQERSVPDEVNEPWTESLPVLPE